MRRPLISACICAEAFITAQQSIAHANEQKKNKLHKYFDRLTHTRLHDSINRDIHIYDECVCARGCSLGDPATRGTRRRRRRRAGTTKYNMLVLGGSGGGGGVNP